MHLPAREHNAKKSSLNTNTSNKISDLLANTSHTITFRSNRYFCSSCHNNFRSGDPGLKAWLSVSCSHHNPQEFHKPTRVYDSIHIGNSCAHVSHELYSYRGFIYCGKCGNYGVQHFSGLARECHAPKLAGARFLKNIASGQLPCGFTAWPD